MLGELVAAGCVLDEVDGVGWMAAHYAVWAGYGDVVEALLEIGKEQSVDVFGAR